VPDRRPRGRAAVALLISIVVAFVLALPVAAGEQDRAQRRDGDGTLRVLFIGNSLTYTNDMPAMLEAIAAAEPGPGIEIEVVAVPNYSLEDHWNQGDAVRAIRRGGWSVVVLQQGPSALSESRVLLIDYAKRFAEEIQRAGARPALYMVWPSRARSFDFPGVSASYTAAAKAVSGVLLPAGDAWRKAWRLDPDLVLYGPDGFHPSRLGSVLAALVIYRRLASLGATASAEQWSDGPRWAPALGVDADVAATFDRAAADIRRKVSP
jgi:hypothetical protein